jgi:hypothetical protein
VLAFSKKDGRVTYFNESMPMFVHDEKDQASFQVSTAQFCVNGNAEQADIVRAFGVTKISLERALKRDRHERPKGCYKPHKRHGPAVSGVYRKMTVPNAPDFRSSSRSKNRRIAGLCHCWRDTEDGRKDQQAGL